MVKEEKWAWAVIAPILLWFSWLWIDANGFLSFLGMAAILIAWSLFKVWTGDINPSSSDDEITVIDSDGNSTKYIKKD